jgi:hypothetical protein
LAPDTEHAEINKLFDRLSKHNQYNFSAILPLRHVDMGAVDIEWSTRYGEYETSATIDYKDPFTETWETISTDDRDDLITRTEQSLDAIDDELRDLERREAELEGNVNEDGASNPAGEAKHSPAILAEIQAVAAKRKELMERNTKLEELLDNLRDADEDTAELMWNTSWRPFDDDVDVDIVERIPQITWVRATDGEDEGNTYLTLTCIGQDNGPALMAYVVLAHGVVPEQYLSYWTSQRSWTEYVIGRRLFMECADKLGVAHVLSYHLRCDDEDTKDRRIKEAESRARKAEIADLPVSDELRSLVEQAVAEDADGKYRRVVDLARNRYTELISAGRTADAALKDPLLREMHRYAELRECLSELLERDNKLKTKGK